MDFVWWMKALFLGLFGLAALFLLYIMLIMCVTRRGIVSVLVNYVYLPMIWYNITTFQPRLCFVFFP
jgi:membrane-anchored glycerophosphoryl diester phosphodiesterase (GDPDase)